MTIDVEPELKLAGELFDKLRAGSRGALGITRASYGAGEQMAHDLIAQAGAFYEKRIDAAGNLYLTLPGRDRGKPAILMGSHLDSVPEGGNFDGAAGVVAGLCVLERLRRLGHVPAQDVGVMAIRAEELACFPVPYIGSRAAFGLLPAGELDGTPRRDTGRSLAAHMAESGFDPDAIRRAEPQLKPDRLRCYLELHIEQGPALVAAGKPAGIVTGIRGNLRYFHCRIDGQYGHAGAEPRATRADALMAGCAFVGELEALWDEHDRDGRDLVCTVGQFHTDIAVHTMTKIPGEVRFTLDLRSQDNEVLLALDRRLRAIAERLSAERRLKIDLGAYTNALPGPIDPALKALMADTASAAGIDAMELASGAGHDAAVFGVAGVPTAMVFVRNDRGSHNPHEAMELADFGAALAILAGTVDRLDAMA